MHRCVSKFLLVASSSIAFSIRFLRSFLVDARTRRNSSTWHFLDINNHRLTQSSPLPWHPAHLPVNVPPQVSAISRSDGTMISLKSSIQACVGTPFHLIHRWNSIPALVIFSADLAHNYSTISSMKTDRPIPPDSSTTTAICTPRACFTPAARPLLRFRHKICLPQQLVDRRILIHIQARALQILRITASRSRYQ